MNWLYFLLALGAYRNRRYRGYQYGRYYEYGRYPNYSVYDDYDYWW